MMIPTGFQFTTGETHTTTYTASVSVNGMNYVITWKDSEGKTLTTSYTLAEVMHFVYTGKWTLT